MNRSLRATPPRWARPLAAALLALGCSRAPRLSIDSPVAGSRLSAADDVDPALPGVQIPVVASTSAEEGSVGIAHAGSAQASARVQAGKLRFPSVSVADGRQQLTVTVVDSHGLATAQAQVFADSLAAGCRIVSPANGSVVHADPGDTGTRLAAASRSDPC